MKPRFEEHEGQLFRMLEEPTPLTPDAEMPCLVRLIQDDSPMGKHNKDLHGFDPERLTTKLATEVLDVNDLSDPNRGSIRYDGFVSCQYYHYELIGTPVAEGSAEWALYQMMQWKIVCHKKSPSIMYCKRDSKIMREVRCVCVDFMSIDAWLNGADRNGWQLYKKPEPEPIFTTGDVEKPLRSMIAEAKAIGKNIRTYYQDIVFTPQALEACLNQGKFRWWNICNWELTTREQNYFPSISTSSDRPKPEPAKEQFEVGDWVEMDYKGTLYHRQVISVHDNGIRVEFGGATPLISFDGKSSMLLIRLVRKLKPSEVIVHIGCMSGTVRRINDIYFALNPSSKAGWVVPEASIPHAMLDTNTRSLVKSLLEAQEEEE